MKVGIYRSLQTAGRYFMVSDGTNLGILPERVNVYSRKIIELTAGENRKNLPADEALSDIVSKGYYTTDDAIEFALNRILKWFVTPILLLVLLSAYIAISDYNNKSLTKLVIHNDSDVDTTFFVKSKEVLVEKGDSEIVWLRNTTAVNVCTKGNYCGHDENSCLHRDCTKGERLLVVTYSDFKERSFSRTKKQ